MNSNAGNVLSFPQGRENITSDQEAYLELLDKDLKSGHNVSCASSAFSRFNDLEARIKAYEADEDKIEC